MEDSPKKPGSDPSSAIETKAEEFFRKWPPPVVLLGVGFWALFAGCFLAYHSWKDGFIVRIVEEHFPGMILVPMGRTYGALYRSAATLDYGGGALSLNFEGKQN